MAAVLETAGETSPSFFELPVNNDRDAIIANVRTNVARALPGLPKREEHRWLDVPLIIVAGGPSLHDSLPILKAFRPDCHVLAVNGAYKFLRSEGIDPEHFLLIDSRADNIVHVDSPHEDTNHCLASQVHPRVFEALRDYRVTMFHLGTETTREAIKGSYDCLTAPIGMASVHAVYLAAALGYRKLMLFGYDFSQKPGQTYAFEQPMNRDDGSIEVTLNGKTYRTTLALARTAQQFQLAISPVIRACDLEIQLFSEGLLPDMLRQPPATEESERQKYEEMWEVAAYRKVSPGLESVEDAITKLGITAGSTLADFGCGTGRCVTAFRDCGIHAVGVDIADNCLEEPVPFVRAALWDAQKLPKVDYGFSCDVLEHIPTDRVRDTLKALYDACDVGCYLNIDTVPDSFGVLIGKTLHETVMSAEAWEVLLKELWPHVDSYPGERQAIFVCRK